MKPDDLLTRAATMIETLAALAGDDLAEQDRSESETLRSELLAASYLHSSETTPC